MTTPFQDALLAIDILVDCLHATATASPEAEFAAHEAFAQVRGLGFDTRHTAERQGKPAKTWTEQAQPRKKTQGRLFT